MIPIYEVSFTSKTGESDLDRLREAAALVVPNFTSTPDKLIFKMEREEWGGRLVNVSIKDEIKGGSILNALIKVRI